MKNPALFRKEKKKYKGKKEAENQLPFLFLLHSAAVVVTTAAVVAATAAVVAAAAVAVTAENIAAVTAAYE